MFTGIVEAMGSVTSVEPAKGGRHLRIAADQVLEDIEVGDSVAVNGVCLTVTARGSDHVDLTAVMETLMRSTLGQLKEGDSVNLERPMRTNGRFDGHIVQGHVDGSATISSIEEEGDALRVRLDVDDELSRYLVVKGSVTLDGVSLTVTEAETHQFEVVLIPHTLDVTVWGQRKVGDEINFEADVLAKYVERLMEVRS